MRPGKILAAISGSNPNGFRASVPFSTFVSSRRTHFYERRKQRDTSKFTSACGFAFDVPKKYPRHILIGTSNAPHCETVIDRVTCDEPDPPRRHWWQQ